MEKQMIEFINSLNLTAEQKADLIEKIEWEKELSWSDGWDTGFQSSKQHSRIYGSK